MNKRQKYLTTDQRDRGIIFSSELKKNNGESGKLHEIHKDNEDKDKMIEKLEDDSVFNDSPWDYNEIRS